jgi:hypothetical protein
MAETGLVALAIQLAGADPDRCDRAALAELAALSTRARSWLDAFDVRVAAAARRVGEAPAPLLTGGGRRSVRDAEAVDRRAGVCELLPEVGDALAKCIPS